MQREPEEVEGGRTFAALLSCRRTPKGQKAGLVRMKGQSEVPHPLPENFHHALRVVLLLEGHDEIG